MSTPFDPHYPQSKYPNHRGWLPLLSSPASFTRSSFLHCLENFIIHPELTSSTILRAEITSETNDEVVLKPGWVVPDEQTRPVRVVRRRLLPRSSRDWAMDQDCVFLESVDGGNEGEPVERSTVVLFPEWGEGGEEEEMKRVPFYHPKVKALAFSYEQTLQDDDNNNSDVLSIQATISISIIPFSTTPLPIPPTSRLSRASLLLLHTLHKHSSSHSSLQPYQKRTFHDILVPRSDYQDLYLAMKTRYVWVLEEWREETDARKHLWEDVGIAAWLILLWKEVYPPIQGKEGKEGWGRPKGGFVDVGCGNGLLVYILTAEGYPGYGFDLRLRKSWALFSPLGADLRTVSLTPSSILPGTPPHSPPLFPKDAFLIGNHADELTPWIPVMTALTPGASSVNIACCPHTLDGKFTSKDFSLNGAEVLEAFGFDPDDALGGYEGDGPGLERKVEEMLSPGRLEEIMGPDQRSGRYKAYLRYVASITLSCGLWPEHEALRIPSTKNVAIVARRRCADRPGLTDEQRTRASARGLETATNFVGLADGWVARVPEGKAH